MQFQQSFVFQRPPKIVFGPGEIRNIGKLSAAFGKNVLIVRGKSLLRENVHHWEKITKLLRESSIRYSEFEITCEPSPTLIDEAVELFSDSAIDCVVAIGGGSVIDAGKAISAMLPVRENVTQFLEVVGTRKTDGRKIPMIAVPTTSGTGSEATANAVISVVGVNGFKRSLRHENYTPDIALVDPELTFSCPAETTAACGMDALTQLLESYVSFKASPFSDALCESALTLIGKHLVDAVKHGMTDLDSRIGMSYASLVSGIALANAGLGVVHGLASLIGALFPIPHGVVCGTLLAGSVKSNIEKMTILNAGHPALNKYACASSILLGKNFPNNMKAHNDLIEYLFTLTEELSIPLLSTHGVNQKDIARFLTENVNKNNPVQLTDAEIGEILNKRIIG
jgi:alcohol dehydrogenase class IV